VACSTRSARLRGRCCRRCVSLWLAGSIWVRSIADPWLPCSCCLGWRLQVAPWHAASSGTTRSCEPSVATAADLNCGTPLHTAICSVVLLRRCCDQPLTSTIDVVLTSISQLQRQPPQARVLQPACAFLRCICFGTSSAAILSCTSSQSASLYPNVKLFEFSPNGGICGSPCMLYVHRRSQFRCVAKISDEPLAT